MKLRALALPFAFAAAIAATVPVITGCAPLIIAAAVGGGVLVAADRRSAGTQLDDESTELKIATAASSRYGDNVHLNVTSYNGIVLLTGEVPNQAAKDDIASVARGFERVRSLQNDLVIAPVSSIGERSNDTLITSKLKAHFVEANEFRANQVKVITERGVVYLMGLVTRQEADAASRLASQTGGVVRVVRVFEYIG